MAAVVTAHEVENAVNEFYKNPSGKAQVHSWLSHAQHSTHAWNFAFQLLDPSKSGEVQFFGGNTIYIKVSRHWHEVPKEEYEGLKMKLLHLSMQFSNNKAIVGRLLKAISAFVLNTLSDSWPSAVEDLVSIFNPDTVTAITPSAALDMLFTIFMLIPDELEDSHDSLALSRPNKNTVRGLLIEKSKNIVKLMQQVMHAPQVSNVTKEIVIKALESWMKLPLDLSATKDLLLELIPFCKYGLLCECIIECFKTALCSNDCNKIPQTVIEFIMELLKLTPVLEEALHSEDENTASLVYGLYSSIVENHSRLLLNVALEDEGERRAAVLQLISLLVQCSGTPGQYPTQEMLSNIPFSVWYTLQDDLVMFFKGPKMDKLTQLLKPIYLQLVDFFLTKSLLPPDEALNSEEKELFRCYRQDICDSYMHTYIILKSSMLEQMENHLHSNVARLQRDPNDWRPLESLLHAYASVAETVQDHDAGYILRFIQFIPQIPFGDNVLLISVALSTLGAYADWLNFHQDHLQYVIPLMVAGVVNERLVGAASQALRDLTLECPGTISPFALPILDACQKALVQYAECDTVIKERLITIIARVLSVGVSRDVVIEHLNHTLTPIIGTINSIKERARVQGQMTKDQHIELVTQLRLLACLARSLNNSYGYGETAGGVRGVAEEATALQDEVVAEQPLLMVLSPLLSILDGLVDMTSNMPDVVEVLCKLFKNSISTLLSNIEPLLPNLISIIPRIYQNSLSPSVLDVVKHILVLFGGVNSIHLPQMKALAEGILTYTLQRINNDIWNYTHVVQAILTFTTSVCKKLGHLLNPDQIHTVFVLAIEALKLPEEGTIKASSLFLMYFMNISRDYKGEMYKHIIHQNKDRFVRTLMTCICNSPRHGLSPISELLHLLCKYFGGGDLMNIFKQIENDNNFLCPRISKQDKEKFSKALLRASNSKEAIIAVTDLALVSRGVAGTEYGASTSNNCF